MSYSIEVKNNLGCGFLIGFAFVTAIIIFIIIANKLIN